VALINRGAVPGWHIGCVELILDAHGDAMKRAFDLRLVALPGLREGQLGVEELPGMDSGLSLLDPVHARLDQLFRGDLARLDPADRLDRREPV
jgi:hypothetical protein